MTTPLHVLIVEDLESDALLLLRELKLGNYDVTFERVQTAPDMQTMLMTKEWDIVISDFSMPQFDAPSALKVLRQHNADIPFIIVSGTVGEDAAVDAMKSGANDFFSKGRLKRLVPAVERELRDAKERRQRRWAEEQFRRSAHRLEILHSIDRAILSAQSPQTIAQAVLEQLSDLINFWSASVLTFNHDTKEVTVLAVTSTNDSVFSIDEKYTFDQFREERFTQHHVLVVEDLDTLPTLTDIERKMLDIGVRSYLNVPLISSHHLAGSLNIGSLDLRSMNPADFKSDEIEIAQEIGDQLAIAIVNSRLLEIEKQRNAELTALHQASLQLTQSLALSVVLDMILNYALQLVKADDAHIFLYDGEELRFGAAQWDGVRQSKPIAQPRHDGLTYTVARTGDRMIISDVNTHDIFQEWQWNGAIIGLPLDIAGQVMGVMSLAFDQPHNFTDHEVRVLELLADQAAVAINNAQLYEKTQQSAEELERRVVERTAQLQREKDRVEAILRDSSDAILILDSNGVIKQVNPAFYAIFGYSTTELNRQLFVNLFPLNQRDLLLTTFQQVIQENFPQRLELAVTRQANTIFEADVALSPIKINGTNHIEVVCSLRDITALKHVEAELRNALEKEQELRELKNRFVSMASHEFRTPLATLQVASDLLSHYWQQMDEAVRIENLTRIAGQVDHMTALLDDVLLIGRLEAGEQIDITLTQINLVTFCQELVQQYQSITQSKHQIVFTSTGDSSQFHTDKKLIRQIISNLLSNAVKYSPNGGVITVNLDCGDQNITLSISDQGIGIPEADQKHLFKTFHRAANVGQISGTGLGLAILKRAIDLLGGQIDFQSVVNEGTTFIVTLPRTPTETP